jgi:hypothetical protein
MNVFSLKWKFVKGYAHYVFRENAALVGNVKNARFSYLSIIATKYFKPINITKQHTNKYFPLSAFSSQTLLCLSLMGPPLWSSGQSSWLQIQISGFDSRRYQIFREVVDLERGPLSLVSTIEELLDRKVAAPV